MGKLTTSFANDAKHSDNKDSTVLGHAKPRHDPIPSHLHFRKQVDVEALGLNFRGITCSQVDMSVILNYCCH